MNDRIRGWAEVAANVGVFLGILFLIYEVRQTPIGQRMEAELGLGERFAELDGSVAENADLTDLLVRADSDCPPLNAKGAFSLFSGLTRECAATEVAADALEVSASVNARSR